ncbi:MAG: T9SS type A sorting domain-containing protein, partial [Ignavibacteriae bacterium]|nr:T9SS type A sorting domain-containing protein [Ignavibacteriota bacterium]
ALVRVIGKPKIVETPKAIDTVKSGGIIHLGISAVGVHPLQYRWKKDGVLLDGEYSPLFHKIGITKTDAGNYECLVSNGCDTITVAMKVVVVTSTGVDEFSQVGYQLEQSIPNPASSSVTFEYTLPESSSIKLSVTDMLGRIVWQSPNEEMISGLHSVTVDVSTLPTGVYYYSLSTPKTSLTRKLEIVR